MKNYKLVELNNKTRKGLYAYVKKPKEKGKYYKVEKGIPIETKIQYYEKKKQQKGIRIPKPKARRRRTIESTLRKGIKTIKTTDLTSAGINTAKRRLFKNIVKDKEIMNILITEHNLQKIKHRFDYKLLIYGKKGLLLTAEKLNITPDRARTELQNINTGEEYGGSKWAERKGLKKNNWTLNYNTHEKQTITRKVLQITFRKA